MEPAEYQLMDVAEERMWWYRALHAQTLDALDLPPRARPAGRLLDAGCGTGGFLTRLGEARPGMDAMGLEVHPPAAARARAKSGRTVVAGSVNDMPFGDGAFTALVSLDVLSHAAVRPEQALAEMHRVLTPGGRLVLNLPAFQWLHSAHDVRVHNARRFHAAGVLAALRAAGFQPVAMRYWNALLLPLMVLQRKVLARAPDNRSDVAPFPPWLDRTLHAVTVLERRLMTAGLPFPAGGSLLAVATRP